MSSWKFRFLTSLGNRNNRLDPRKAPAAQNAEGSHRRLHVLLNVLDDQGRRGRISGDGTVLGEDGLHVLGDLAGEYVVRQVEAAPFFDRRAAPSAVAGSDPIGRLGICAFFIPSYR